ncbi:MAG: V-type ATP synthase subunit I [Firmicutes bacterium]|nr:V-type ATP synthase subunit I [Bacillota bacterium]
MAILKMKFINIVGPIHQFDDIVMEHVIENGIHLENAIGVLGHLKGLYPYMEDNPYEQLMKKAEKLFGQMQFAAHSQPKVVCDYPPEQMEKYLDTVGDKLNDFIAQKERVENDIAGNRQVITHLTPMKNVDVQLERFFNMNFIKFRFGKLPRDSYKKLQMYLKDVEVFVTSVLHEGDYEWIVYFAPAYFQEKIDSIFSSLYFERIRITGKVNGTPAQALVKVEREIAQLQKEQETLDQAFNAFVLQEKEEFLKIYSTMKFLYESFDVRKYAAHTKESFYITGWIPQKRLKAFTAKLDKNKNISYIVEEAEIVKKSRPPTELRNIPIFKPFESLVKTYGLPSYQELDPTAFIAVTYILFFGMMFGDIGHGAVLVIIGWFLYKKRGLPIGGVIMSAAVSSIIFGWLYGSVFGYEHLIPESLIWMHPMQKENIPVIMGISLVLGIVVISIAMILNIINGIKSKNVARILFDKNGIAGVVFYWSVISFVLYSIYKGKVVISGIVIVACLVLPLLCIAMKEPLERLLHKEKKLLPDDKGGFFAEAFFEVVETLLGFMGNTMSFIRVSAFALNHAGLSMAVLILAELVKGVGSGIVILLGNILVIGLEGLIVGIQVLRLEYYELFNRFFSGEGRPFTPLTIAKED